VIYSQSTLGLPLVHHLVQHGVLDLGPWVPGDVTSTQCDVDWPAGLDVDRELAQPSLHPRREPNLDLAEGTAEVMHVQVLVKAGEPVQQGQITRAGELQSFRSWPGRRVLVHRKCQKFLLGQPTERPRNPWVEEPDNGAEHSVRRIRVTEMQPEYSPGTQTQHHTSIGMGDESGVPGPEHEQPFIEQFLPRRSFAPLRTGSAAPSLGCSGQAPLSRPHNP
jgi:hypothetical protein